MTTIIMCFFDGTPIQLAPGVYENLKELKIDPDETYDDYYDNIVLFEKTLCKHSIAGMVQERSIAKAAKELGLTPAQFQGYWCVFVYTLVKIGRIKDDNENGFLVMKGNLEVLEHDNSEMLCGLCRAPSKLKCAKCGQRYCCREHQVSDWKKHKQECYGVLSTEEWRKRHKSLTTPQRS